MERSTPKIRPVVSVGLLACLLRNVVHTQHVARTRPNSATHNVGWYVIVVIRIEPKDFPNTRQSPSRFGIVDAEIQQVDFSMLTSIAQSVLARQALRVLNHQVIATHNCYMH